MSDEQRKAIELAAQKERRFAGEGSIFHATFKDRKTKEVKRTLTWYVSYTDLRGKRHVESTGSRVRRVASDLLTKRLGEIRAGQPVGPEVEKTTFDELATLIKNDYVINGRKSGDRLEQSLAHLREAFGGQLAKAIEEGRVDAYKAYRKSEGATNGTINRELAALKRMFKLGRRRVARIPDIVMLEEHNRRRGFFEPEQFHAVKSHLPHELQPVAHVAYITGWRVESEILPLEWADVDFVHEFIRLEDSKNGEARMFPFTPELKAILEAQRKRTQALQEVTGQIIPYVFWRMRGPSRRQPERGHHAARIKTYRRAWLTACADAGLATVLKDAEGKIVKITAHRIPHDLRRTAIRNLELAGVPRSAAMAMVGHKTESVYRRYAIVDAGVMRGAAGKLAELHALQAKAAVDQKVTSIHQHRRKKA